MLARDGNDATQQVVGVQHTGRVVGVDDRNATGARRDLGADVGQAGQPAVFFVAVVVHRFAAGQAGGSRPQRVVGHGHQQFIAFIQQRVGGHHDQLTRAIAEVNVVQRDTFDTLLLGVVHHRLARGEDALAVGVTGRVGQVADHVLLDFFGGIKTERRHVADVELDDLLALVLHLLGRVHDRAPNVVEHIAEFGGFADGLHGAGAGYEEGLQGCGAPGETYNLTTVPRCTAPGWCRAHPHTQAAPTRPSHPIP